MPRTIVEKIWDEHVVSQSPGAPAVLAIDLHLVHEVTSPQAFSGLRARGLRVRRPDRTVATADHSIPTTPRDLPIEEVTEYELTVNAGALKRLSLPLPESARLRATKVIE